MHFSAPLLQLFFVNNAPLWNRSLEQSCGGGWFTLWLKHQGIVEAPTYWGLDTSLLEHHLDGHLASEDSLWTYVWVHMAAILSVDEALRNLDTSAFVALYFLSAGGRHLSAMAETSAYLRYCRSSTPRCRV